MKYLNHYIVYLFLVFVLASSCRKVIEFDVEDSDRKIVLNTILYNDSVLSANVFRSNHVLDNFTDILYLNNAVVSIYSNNNLIETLQFDSAGYYKGSAHIIEENRDYEFRVESDGLAPISGTTHISTQVPIVSLDSVGIVHIQDYDWVEERVKYKVGFKDIPNQEDFYRIKLYGPIKYFEEKDPNNPFIHIYTYDIISDDPIIEVDMKYTDGYYYFSDRSIDGEAYEFEFIAARNIGGEVTLIASLEHISEDLFRYAMSYSQQQETAGMEMFFQAVQVLNNINGGFGIIGSAAVDVDSIKTAL